MCFFLFSVQKQHNAYEKFFCFWSWKKLSAKTLLKQYISAVEGPNVFPSKSKLFIFYTQEVTEFHNWKKKKTFS